MLVMIDRGEVTGVLVLEHGEVKVEDKDIFSFSINFEVLNIKISIFEYLWNFCKSALNCRLTCHCVE